MPAKWRDRVLAVVLAAVVLALIAIVFTGLVDCFFGAPSQRGWVLLGLMYYIGAVWTQAWERLKMLVERSHYLRVVVSRMDAVTLFEAVTARLEAIAHEQASSFGSRDVEAFTNYDTATGKRIVKFNFWGTRPRHFRFALKTQAEGGSSSNGRSPVVTVEYASGENIILGRDAHVERARTMVLWIRTKPEHIAEDTKLLQSWCEECVGVALEPPPDRVEVYGLQESSSDWVPEWQLERTKSLKSSGHVGDSFYLERPAFDDIRADAQIWAKRSLRLYMVTGPPGVGKTEFTVWLAGRLRLPIYRLSLTMASLTDARLAQLLAQNMMKHETVVVQVDEFQEVISRWSSGGKGISITPGGFNEVLQGSNTLAKGVIVLTGTLDVMSEAHVRAYPALFRRFHIKLELGYLELSDAGNFFRNFLHEFVDNTDDEWQTWQAQFCKRLVRHGPKNLSIDMIKQLLMRRITQACAAGLITENVGTGKYHTQECHKADLADMLMCGASLESFFQAYVGADNESGSCGNA